MQLGSTLRTWRFAPIGALWLVLLGARAAAAPSASNSPTSPAPSASVSATTVGQATEADTDKAPARSKTAQAFADTTARIRDLLGERLAPEFEPRSLFDVDIADPHVVQIERQRLEQLEPDVAPSEASKTNIGKLKRAAKGGVDLAMPEPADSAAAPAAAEAPEPELATPDEVSARLELDRARMDFYRLSVTAGDKLLASLLSTVFGWTLGGAAVVSAIDGLAAQGESGSRKSRLITAHVRLRSLRLLGRVVVAVALVLSLCDQLVGRGTIYAWVLSTCWFAIIPVTLLLARWWHDIIHERLSQKRRKDRLETWVVARDTGWRRLPAALLGGTLLLGRGAVRHVRQRVTKFDLTRRVLAYLFRRDMSRRGDTAPVECGPLAPSVFEILGPETRSREIVPSIADDEMKQVVDHIRAPGGGLFAVVGERGAGKSTLLGRISEQVGQVTGFSCPLGGAAALQRVMAEAVGANANANATLEETASVVDADGHTVALLIDDAHRLILPRMGGLDVFDDVLAAARRHSGTCSWVFAFDEVVWRFFERARGARPLFDAVIRLQPWREEAIARLLVSRTQQAGLEPTFEGLQSALPDDADEVDRAEATEKIAAGYYRLLWDQASGNPGVALHAWRSCLGGAGEGKTAVKVFEPPKTSDLESLPDSAVFVVRAVVQLEFAHPDDIAQATMLDPADIADALRFGVNRGYFRLADGRYWVTWAWFRPITRFLQRRYLLSAA